MDNLTPDERNAFLAIYSGDDDAPVDGPAIESLTRCGLLSRGKEGSVAQTHTGEALYMQLRGDEPYEGI
jgi:hypothetical protein